MSRPSPQPGRRSGGSVARRSLGAVAGALALALLSVWTLRAPAPLPEPPAPLPESGLRAMEPQVAEKLTALWRRVEQHPEDGEAWGWLAMNLDVHDLHEASIPCYRQARALAPRDFRWPYYGALALQKLGSPEAVVWLEGSRALDPAYAPADIRYGQALLAAGRLSEALETFRRAVDGPLGSHALLGMAQVTLARGDLEASLGYLQTAVETRPEHAEVHGLLAEVNRRLGRTREAETNYRQARPQEQAALPDPLVAEWAQEGVSTFWYQMRGRMHLAQGRYAEAAREFSRALESQPSSRDHNNLGVALQKQGRPDEAIEHYRSAIALTPDYAEALNNLGSALAEVGRSAEAIPYVEQALSLDPTLSGAHLNLGTLLLADGRGERAVAAFQRGLSEARGGTTQIALRLAWVLATWPEPRVRNGSEALELALDLCAATRYGNPAALDALAAAYAEVGDFDRAVKVVSQAQQLALSADEPAVVRDLERHLASYRTARPYREGPGGMEVQSPPPLVALDKGPG